MRRAARATLLTVLSALVAPALFVSAARADEPKLGSGAFVIPPSPARAAPRLAVEVHTGLTVPLDNSSLCPRGRACVFESGGGVGFSLERRFPSGFGALVGYDTWFIDSDYELAVQQLLHGGLRFTMPTDVVFHPIFEGSVGVMGFGDAFRIETVGFVWQAFAGAETELTESFAVRLGFGLRAFSHSPFRKQSDDVKRGGGVFSEAAFVQVGLTVM